jgi:hypothetical protein
MNAYEDSCSIFLNHENDWGEALERCCNDQNETNFKSDISRHPVAVTVTHL